MAGGIVALSAIRLVCALSPEHYKQETKETKNTEISDLPVVPAPIMILVQKASAQKLAKLSWQGGALVCESFPGLFLAEEYAGKETGQ